MSLLLALENALHNRVKYAIGHSAVVLRLAQTFMESGQVTENVNVVVRFNGSNIVTPNNSANTSVARVKDINFEVEVRYKQSQYEGHSFAIAMLDAISTQINGYVPDLSPMFGINTKPHYVFQTGFELTTESPPEFNNAHTYIYKQNYQIRIILPERELSPVSCPIEYERISLKNLLPCKRCLRTTTGVPIGLAEWRRPSDDYIVFVYDPSACPPRPGDKLDITLLKDEEGNSCFIPDYANPDNFSDTDYTNQNFCNYNPGVYEIDLKFTPREAISYSPEGEISVDTNQCVSSSIDRFYFSPDGSLPDNLVDFSIIFGVYDKPDNNNVREAFFLGGDKDDYLF